MALSAVGALKQYFLGAGSIVCGPVIYENLAQSSNRLRYLGLHGTTLLKIESQLKRGTLDSQGKDVYFYRNFKWNASRAAFWGGNESDAVVALLGSDTPPIKNLAYRTFCFPRTASEIKILKVWKVSEDWKEIVWKKHCKN